MAGNGASPAGRVRVPGEGDILRATRERDLFAGIGHRDRGRRGAGIGADRRERVDRRQEHRVVEAGGLGRSDSSTTR